MSAGEEPAVGLKGVIQRVEAGLSLSFSHS